MRIKGNISRMLDDSTGLVLARRQDNGVNQYRLKRGETITAETDQITYTDLDHLVDDVENHLEDRSTVATITRWPFRTDGQYTVSYGTVARD